jgi:uncharacterized protein with NRDE domain
MCLALIAIEAHPTFTLVVAANRDEFHARPAAPAAWWDEGWLGGRDLAAGGAWLGIARDARWALVTNFRDPSRNKPDAPTRGSLVPAALADPAPPAESLARIVRSATAQNGFNLVVGTGSDACWGSNRANGARQLPPGIHGISNALLDTPWPKVTRTKSALQAWCARGDADLAPLFALLGDRVRAPDDLLPSTGIPRERERLLSSPFIVDDGYGTRCSTVLTIDRDDGACFVERTFDPRGAPVGEVTYRFAVTSRNR